MVFLGSEDRCVYALDAINGMKKWEFKSGHKKHSPPVVAKDKVLISGDKDLYALNINDGSVLWVAKDTSRGGHHVPIVAEDFVISTNEVTILSLADGTVLEKLTPDFKLAGHRDIVVSKGIIYALLDGTMHAFDLTTRELIWYAPVNPGVMAHYGFWASLDINTCWTLGKEFAFVTTLSTKKGLKYSASLHAINVSRLMKRWEVRGFSKGFSVIVSPPLINNEMIIVSCGKKVTAFRCSKDPASQRLLEVGDEVVSSPEYTSVPLLPEGQLPGTSEKSSIIWPDFCCLCCGPVEKRAKLHKKGEKDSFGIVWNDFSVPDIPYCSNCFEKTKRRFLKKGEEEPGVEIAEVSPPTLAFRNEKYWAMFMEANRLR